MLVYRVVPENIATVIGSECGCFDLQAQTSEDAFYDIGYMNFTDANSYFKLKSSDPLISRSLNTFGKTDEKTKAFFLSPWDAVCCSIYLNYDFYSSLGVNIFEYDIPDDILSNYFGFGSYNGEYIPEYRIPISVLKGNAALEEEYSDEIKAKLIERYRARRNECISELSELLKRAEEKLSKWKSEEISVRSQSMSKLFSDKEKEQHFSNFRMRQLGVSFKSNMITGRSFFVSEWDVFRLHETKDITNLISRSNGILTQENWHYYEDYKNNHLEQDIRNKGKM